MKFADMRRVESGRTGDFYYQGRHSSGLEIYLYPKQTGQSTKAVLGVKYGAIDNCFQREGEEPKKFPLGIAHYLEHKLFESEEGDAFARFAKTGASANAYTGFETTSYVFSCTQRLYDSLEILLDFVQSPYFTENTVAKERGIITQEIKMYDDMPGWRVMLEYLKAMYHAHPVREDAAGTVDSIGEITAGRLYSCYEAFYNPANMVLVVCGRFQPERVLSICDRMFMGREQRPVRRILPQEPVGIVKSRVENYLPVAMPVFQFGYKEDGAGRRTEDDLAAVNALLFILASDSSPMFRRLMDEGLINDSSFSYQYFEGTGYANIMFGGESRDPDMAAEIIAEELRRLRQEGIAEEDFLRAKRSLYGDCVAAQNSAGAIAGWVSDFALAGLEMFKYIDALAELELEKVREKLSALEESRSVLSIIWPLEKRKDEGL